MDSIQGDNTRYPRKRKIRVTGGVTPDAIPADKLMLHEVTPKKIDVRDIGRDEATAREFLQKGIEANFPEDEADDISKIVFETGRGMSDIDRFYFYHGVVRKALQCSGGDKTVFKKILDVVAAAGGKVPDHERKYFYFGMEDTREYGVACKALEVNSRSAGPNKYSRIPHIPIDVLSAGSIATSILNEPSHTQVTDTENLKETLDKIIGVGQSIGGKGFDKYCSYTAVKALEVYGGDVDKLHMALGSIARLNTIVDKDARDEYYMYAATKAMEVHRDDFLGLSSALEIVVSAEDGVDPVIKRDGGADEWGSSRVKGKYYQHTATKAIDTYKDPEKLRVALDGIKWFGNYQAADAHYFYRDLAPELISRYGDNTQTMGDALTIITELGKWIPPQYKGVFCGYTAPKGVEVIGDDIDRLHTGLEFIVRSGRSLAEDPLSEWNFYELAGPTLLDWASKFEDPLGFLYTISKAGSGVTSSGMNEFYGVTVPKAADVFTSEEIIDAGEAPLGLIGDWLSLIVSMGDTVGDDERTAFYRKDAGDFLELAEKLTLTGSRYTGVAKAFGWNPRKMYSVFKSITGAGSGLNDAVKGRFYTTVGKKLIDVFAGETESIEDASKAIGNAFSVENIAQIQLSEIMLETLESDGQRFGGTLNIILGNGQLVNPRHRHLFYTHAAHNALQECVTTVEESKTVDQDRLNELLKVIANASRIPSVSTPGKESSVMGPNFLEYTVPTLISVFRGDLEKVSEAINIIKPYESKARSAEQRIGFYMEAVPQMLIDSNGDLRKFDKLMKAPRRVELGKKTLEWIQSKMGSGVAGALSRMRNDFPGVKEEDIGFQITRMRSGTSRPGDMYRASLFDKTKNTVGESILREFIVKKPNNKQETEASRLGSESEVGPQVIHVSRHHIIEEDMGDQSLRNIGFTLTPGDWVKLGSVAADKTNTMIKEGIIPRYHRPHVHPYVIGKDKIEDLRFIDLILHEWEDDDIIEYIKGMADGFTDHLSPQGSVLAFGSYEIRLQKSVEEQGEAERYIRLMKEARHRLLSPPPSIAGDDRQQYVDRWETFFGKVDDLKKASGWTV